MAKKKVQKKGGVSGIAALAAAGAAAAAAGYYFYASKDAAKNRKQATKWAVDMKKEVVNEAKKLKKLDRAVVAKVVDKAAAAYKSASSVNRADLSRAVRELKTNWEQVSKEAKGAVKDIKKHAKKAKTQIAKKVAK